MNIAVLGTGIVGRTIGDKLMQIGHQVTMGSRTADNPKAAEWAAAAGPGAAAGTYEDAARAGDVIFNCTSGAGSLEALRAAGEESLAGKILIDVANPLDFSNGFPPSLSIVNTDSLGEQIQREFPELRVVKTLNTMNTGLMVNPSLVPGDHTVFMSGDDDAAKEQVAGWLTEWFGWKPKNIIDLGDITTARGTEQLLPVWVRLYARFGSPNFNFHIVTT